MSEENNLKKIADEMKPNEMRKIAPIGNGATLGEIGLFKGEEGDTANDIRAKLASMGFNVYDPNAGRFSNEIKEESND